MKKILLTGLLAISALSLSQQEASAWINSRFGIGLNWDFQSGGNSILWGLWRNGQPPGPEAFGHPGYPGHLRMPHHGMSPQPMPVYGVSPGFVPAPQGFMPPPAPQGFLPAAQTQPQPMYYTPYQFANYPRPVYYYYPTPYYIGQ